MKQNQFKCAGCKGIFTKTKESEWSEEDRNKEHKEIYGFEANVYPTETICDDCHVKVTGWFNKLTDEEKEFYKSN